MTFLHPVFLLGTLAAAVPVILHLIARRRALVHRFPAVRFLLLADKRTARKFRVHQWLLLALRVLAICLLALVLARPRLSGSGAQAAVAQPPEAVVLVLDNSLSMAYRDGQRSRWERAPSVGHSGASGAAASGSRGGGALAAAARSNATVFQQRPRHAHGAAGSPHLAP
ncbi:MAG: hypothetical protein KatS3mg131_2570 [Candidatus Tectimicrobiota bacterium]|nr:MAG: hypothetical protein KatS3mg131_2570 [Candidatus Tectomicrobia bacterium]